MALSVLQFMVAKLVFQVECRKKVAGVLIFCFQFGFSLLVKISRLMLEPCMYAQTKLHRCTFSEGSRERQL